MTWEERWSKSKNRPYYFNSETGESVWEKPSSSLSSEDIQNKSQQVRVAHILIKHRDSRRPSSWKEENITRSKEAAIDILKAIRDKIVVEGADFYQLAQTESHCSSAKAGGDLGFFGPGKMQVGQISEIVDTASGVHIIKRIA